MPSAATSTNSSEIREFTPAEQQELTNRLLSCPILGTPSGRQSVINNLPEDIKVNISLANMNNARQEVGAILTACLEYSTGLAALMQSVRFFDKGTIKLGRVEQYLTQLGLNV